MDILRATESFLRANEVWYSVNECTVIVLNQRSAQMNDYFALMTSKRCNLTLVLITLHLGKLN